MSDEALVRILGIGTAVPPGMDQARILDIALGLNEGTDTQRDLLRRIYLRCGVERRGIALEQAEGMLEAFYPHHAAPCTAERMRAYEQLAPDLAERAVRDALDKASIEAARITHLITVSCTGFFSPGVDAALIERLGLPRGIRRTNIGFMGCHAALNAIETARSIARSSPEARVLVCCVELCSLHLAYGWEMQQIVANALFADGSAAVVIGRSGDERGWAVIESASYLLPDTKPDMGWTIGDHGFAMTLSSQVPAHVRTHLRSWCDAWLGEAGTNIASIDHWLVHPGGPKVLDAAAESLAIDPARLSLSREVLRDHGNMSSGTVLFILQRLGAAAGQCVVLAFGPGLVLEGLLLRRGSQRAD